MAVGHGKALAWPRADVGSPAATGAALTTHGEAGQAANWADEGEHAGEGQEFDEQAPRQRVGWTCNVPG
ncbi:hypothetical protein NL676_038928 [Syzygium grande]|nr:hypothetical protein NL676_038928 [Syzygium grande]